MKPSLLAEIRNVFYDNLKSHNIPNSEKVKTLYELAVVETVARRYLDIHNERWEINAHHSGN